MDQHSADQFDANEGPPTSHPAMKGAPQLDALRESESRFRASFELAPVGLAHCGLGGRFLAVNACLCTLLGRTREELLATRFQDLTHPDDLAEDLNHALELLAGDVESYTISKRYVQKSGSTLWARMTGSLVRDDEGAPFYFLAVVDEITGHELDRLRAEKADAERLAIALTAAEDGAWDWDVSTGVVHYSERFCRMLGYAPGEISPDLGGWERLVHPRDIENVRSTIKAHLEGRTALYENEHRIRRRDGQWAWMLDRGKVVERDGEGRPLRMVGTYHDITATKEVTAALAASEAQARRQVAELDSVYRTAPVGLGFVDADLKFVRVNERLAAMNGLPPEEHIGRTPAEVTPTIAPFIEPLLRSVLNTGEAVRQLEYRAEAPGEPGAIRDWLINYAPAIDAGGSVVGVTCAVAEITPLKRAEAEAKAGILAAEAASRAKGDFIATMSHEMRTPLNAIGGHAQLLEMELHGPITAEQREALRRIEQAKNHLLRVVNDVLDLARIQGGAINYNIKALSLVDVIAELEPLIGPQVRAKGLTLTVKLDEQCKVLADRDRLVQVLLNLVANAVKFTPTGGSVVIESLAESADYTESGFRQLRVTDTGIGIPNNKLDAVFEPFTQVDASGAGPSAGVGLGLAISRDLARGMGGDIRVHSTPGVGSAFTIMLRRA